MTAYPVDTHERKLDTMTTNDNNTPPRPQWNATDTTILARRKHSLARSARSLAGTFYRAAPWGQHPNATIAEMLCAVAAPVSSSATNVYNVQVGGHLPYGRSRTVIVPARLVALADDRPHATRADALDTACDLLCGFALLNGTHEEKLQYETLYGAYSQHGFGFTMWKFGAEPVTAEEYTQTLAADLLAVQDRSRRGYALTLTQRALAEAARHALAHQWIAEAADGTLATLDRARRIWCAAHIDATLAAEAKYGEDAAAEALTDYAQNATADTRGEDAWQRFHTAADAARQDADRAADNHPQANQKDRTQYKANHLAVRAGCAARQEAEHGLPFDAGRTSSAREDERQRTERTQGAVAPLPSDTMPKRTKAQREAAAAADANEIAARASGRFSTGSASATGGEWVARPIVIH